MKFDEFPYERPEIKKIKQNAVSELHALQDWASIIKKEIQTYENSRKPQWKIEAVESEITIIRVSENELCSILRDIRAEGIVRLKHIYNYIVFLIKKLSEVISKIRQFFYQTTSLFLSVFHYFDITHNDNINELNKMELTFIYSLKNYHENFKYN